MNRELPEFNFLLSLGHWALAVLVLTLAALFVGFIVAVATMGSKGPSFVIAQLKKLGIEMTNLSPGRVMALTSLTVKESLRRKALYVFVVFALLFMFAGWFIGDGGGYISAKPYIDFVLKTVQWLSLPVAILLACWGLPADIKARSLHTVVTKPVRRTEVVLGRILGYSAVASVVVLAMGAIAYVWIDRSVPDYARSQLIGRVPVKADNLIFLGNNGELRLKGINVGDIYEFRSYVSGGTDARAIFIYEDFADTASYYIDAGEPIPLEYDFEVFRSYKGDIGEDVLAGTATDVVGTQAQFAVLAEPPGFDPEADADAPFSGIGGEAGRRLSGPQLRLRFPEYPFELAEFDASVTDAVQELPLAFEQVVGDAGVQSFSLVEDGLRDLDGDGEKDDLAIAVRMLDRQQYLGVAQSDLFVRLPDKSFVAGYVKAIVSILLSCILVIIVGTTASTFVKGPVATLVTLGLIGVGLFSQGFADEYLGGFQSTGEALGGGPIESLYRLVTQKSQTVALEESAAISTIETIDRGLLLSLVAAFQVLPDMRTFDLTPYVSSGFDPPFWSAFMPGVLVVIGFLIPCLIVGYLSLQLRELESK